MIKFLCAFVCATAIFNYLPATFACEVFRTEASSKSSAFEDDSRFLWTHDGSFDFEGYAAWSLNYAFARIERSRIQHPFLEDTVIGQVHMVIARLKSGDLNNSQPGDNMKTYMNAIIQNAFRSFWKLSQSKFQHSLEEAKEDLNFEPEGRKSEGEDAVYLRLVKDTIIEAIEYIASLSKTPDANLKVLQLYYYENKGPQEIAHIMGFTETKVKLIIHRSKEKLKNYLLDRGIYPESMIRQYQGAAA